MTDSGRPDPAPRALSFGAAASDYERFRPGYPDDLVDAVLAYAGRPVLTALEIGAGTGKATRAFAARGIAVTATEPDPAMLAELRRHVPASVTSVRTAFENLTADARYDLVFAAASLHWTAPAGRWTRIAGMLVDDGVFACLGGPFELADAELANTVRETRRDVLPTDDVAPPEDRPAHASMQWPGDELAASGEFTDVRELAVERRLTLTRDEYVGHLGTVSAYLALPGDARGALFDRIRGVLPDEVAVDADLTVHLARRSS